MHPFERGRGGISGVLRCISDLFAWKKTVLHARRHLRAAIKQAIINKLPKLHIQDMREHLSDTKTFSPWNSMNSKQSRKLALYLSSAPDPEAQLHRIRELFGERQILPITDCEQKLWVHRITVPHGLAFCGHTDSFLSSISAETMFKNAIVLQTQANKYLRDALTAKTLHYYQYSLHMAAPHFKAALRAFAGAKKRSVDINDNAAAGNAEAERYVCEERYVQCAHSVSMCGVYIVQAPFAHLLSLTIQKKLTGAHKSTTDLISYLNVNDVCFPSFTKTAWARCTRSHDPLEYFSSARRGYVEALGEEMDIVSFQVLCHTLNKKYLHRRSNHEKANIALSKRL